MRVPTRQRPRSTDTDRGAGSSAWARLAAGGRRHGSRSRTGARAGQASLGGAIALLAVPAICLLVLAALGVGSAVGASSPRHRTFGAASAGISGVSAASIGARESGLAGAIGSLDALQGVQTAGTDKQGSASQGDRPSADTVNEPIASAKAVVAQAVAQGPSEDMHPMADPAVVAAAAASAAAAAKPKSPGTVTIVTFGYSFGDPPSGSKFVADVQNIESPNFSQFETGLSPSVRDRVMAVPAAQAWLQTMRTSWIPSLKDGDQVAVGCKRGHHRSVTLAVLLAEDLRARGYTVNLVHRDILKSY